MSCLTFLIACASTSYACKCSQHASAAVTTSTRPHAGSVLQIMWASALLVVALVTGASANFEPPPPPPQLPAYVRFNAGECSAATEAPIDFTTLAAASFGETTECSAATDTCAFKVRPLARPLCVPS